LRDAGLAGFRAAERVAVFSLEPAWKPLRIAFAATAVAGIAYGIVLLFGARIAEHESLRPLAMVGLVSSDTADDFKNVSDESDLDAAIASASKQGRITLIDFSAEWCTECKVMERSVFSQDIVRRQLRGMFLIRADLTHLDQSSKKLMRRFGVVGPPTIIFLSPDGTEISDTRIVGGTEVEAFLTKIAKALRA
jgi:thiol:disulfide interchange protein DsbD